MGSLKKVVKKVAKPEVIIPLALIAATGGAAAPALGAKGAAAGAGSRSWW
jgi:predicted flavoprotein YhiN